MTPGSTIAQLALRCGAAALLVLALAACGPGGPGDGADPSGSPEPTPVDATASGEATEPAEPGASESGPAPTDAAADPGAEPAASDHVSCGDAFVLAQFENSPWVWEGDDAQQLASAEPVLSFSPEEAIAGLEARCVTTYRMPIDVNPGVAEVSVAIVDAAGGSAFTALDAWAAAEGFERAEYGDVLEYSITADNGNTAAKLTIVVTPPGLSEAEWAALAPIDVADTDLVVRHVDYWQR